MNIKTILALMPFILICLGLLSIVIGAFLIDQVVGWIVLGCALIITAFVSSPGMAYKK